MQKQANINEGDVNISNERKIWINSLSESTKNLLKEDEKYFIRQALSTPCLNVVEDCYDIFLIDSDGNKYMDFHGNNVHQLGYKNSFIQKEVISAIKDLPFSPRRYTNKYTINLAKKIINLCPSKLNKVLFAPSGSLATSMALKANRLISGKHKIISAWDSFHGASIDAISAGGESHFKANIGPTMPGIINVPPYNTFNGLFTGVNSDLKYAEYIEYVIDKEKDIGAILLETIRNTQVHIPTKRFWKKVKKNCDEKGVALILDEIPIFLGRTGKMFAFENFDIVPEMLLIGKGLGGGIYPNAATIFNKKYDNTAETSIGHFTHEKSPVAASAGLAAITFMLNENYFEHVKNLESYCYTQLNLLMKEYHLIADVRGIGLLWALEIFHKTKELSSEITEKIMYDCLKAGLSFKITSGNIITLSPPLIISKKQLNKAFEIIETSIKKAVKSL